MKKLILFLLTATLLILPLSGCFANNKQNEGTTPTNTTENTTPESTTPEVTTPDNPPIDTFKNKRPKELDEIFTLVEQDGIENKKISLNIVDEDLHFELKESGQYDNDVWDYSYFLIVVYCEYGVATDEAWYKQALQSGTEYLNQAFYDYYALNGSLSVLWNFEGLHILYKSVDEFLADYSVVKSFAEFEYVTRISISYHYSLPGTYLIP